MCVVLVCPEKVRPSLETLRECARANPHGGGIAWRKDNAVEWIKTDDVEQIHKIALSLKGEIVIHFRIASVGEVCPELRHPFPVTKKAHLCDNGRTNAVLFQNGTWGGYSEALDFAQREGHKTPEGLMSDTRAAAFLVSIYGHKFLSKLSPSRWVYFSAKETATFGQWYKRGGIYYSNLYWEPARPVSRVEVRRDRESSPERTPAAPSSAHKTKLDRELELWDMAAVSDYWQKVARGPKRH